MAQYSFNIIIFGLQKGTRKSSIQYHWLWVIWIILSYKIIPLSANPLKWSNTLKQFVGNNRRVVWVCLTIMWGWHLKGYDTKKHHSKKKCFCRPLNLSNKLKQKVWCHSIEWPPPSLCQFLSPLLVTFWWRHSLMTPWVVTREGRS